MLFLLSFSEFLKFFLPDKRKSEGRKLECNKLRNTCSIVVRYCRLVSLHDIEVNLRFILNEYSLRNSEGNESQNVKSTEKFVLCDCSLNKIIIIV